MTTPSNAKRQAPAALPTFRTFVRLPLPKTAGACRFGRTPLTRVRWPMQQLRLRAARAAENRRLLDAGFPIPRTPEKARGSRAVLARLRYEEDRNDALWCLEYLELHGPARGVCR